MGEAKAERSEDNRRRGSREKSRHGRRGEWRGGFHALRYLSEAGLVALKKGGVAFVRTPGSLISPLRRPPPEITRAHVWSAWYISFTSQPLSSCRALYKHLFKVKLYFKHSIPISPEHFPPGHCQTARGWLRVGRRRGESC